MLKRCLESIKEKNNIYHDENQYLYLIQDILNYGVMENGRNGKALTIFGSAMHFSLENNTIPLLTTKRVAWKTCIKELLWFISGKTDNSILQKTDVKIWNGNASRDFLDSRNLQHLEENDLGPVYGHQWRSWPTPAGENIDQISQVIDQINSNPDSRRLIVSAWNVGLLDEMALPPCHSFVQFHVRRENELICCLYQRSGDVGLGVPFNIASYSFLTHLLAKHCDLVASEFIHFIGNAHIYDDHVEALQSQLKNELCDFPKISIKEKRANINDYIVDDFEVIDYKHADVVAMNMRS